ncbi:sigma-70 factor domain-containing protein, partial [Campylobacter coli]
MNAKTQDMELEELFKENEKDYITYEKLVKYFSKQPNSATAKKVQTLMKKYKVQLFSAAEIAQMKNIEDAKRLQEEKQKLQDTSLENEFDLANENDLLEWSRSDSPVRMYLREMGQIALLNKDEEIEISKKIELGEDIIIDAFCSVPYLIDFILDYREPLINRERRVKELFKSFDDEEKNDDKLDELEDEDEENDEELENEEETPKKTSKKEDERTLKVIEKFKALEKAKKDWLKVSKDKESGDEILDKLGIAFKKNILKEKLMDLGPTSKLISEIVKSMETALKSDEEFDKELKRLEYRLPMFSEELKNRHANILK